MIANAVAAYVHHLAAFAVVAALVYEHLAFRENLTHAEALRLARMDLGYGISAGVVFVVGMLRFFYFEKGPEFYLGSVAFHAKMTLFAIVGLVSIYPTVVFRSWNRTLRESKAPVIAAATARRVRLALRIELVCIAFVPLFAALMARGVV